MELLEISKIGRKGEVLEGLGGMWGAVEGEDEEDVKVRNGVPSVNPGCRIDGS
jgi:hypothetical protein